PHARREAGRDDKDAQAVGRHERRERGADGGGGLGARLLAPDLRCGHKLLGGWWVEPMDGPSSRTNRAGKIMKTSVKSILMGAFCACGSARALRRLRISTASVRRICPTEKPSTWPCIIARTNDSTAGAGQRATMFSSAWTGVRPIR